MYLCVCVFFPKEENGFISLELYRNVKVKVIYIYFFFFLPEVRIFALAKHVCPKLYYGRSKIFLTA